MVDVNTGKFTGSGGNLEQTVTKNNIEAAEEIVRQLRLRDVGGIIVIDFIDMVLESNRELVLRRLVECLGRDRTKHQVAEVTSLGLVQMTRKRVGQGLLGLLLDARARRAAAGAGIVQLEPVEPKKEADGAAQAGRRASPRGGAAGKADEADRPRSTPRQRPRGRCQGAPWQGGRPPSARRADHEPDSLPPTAEPGRGRSIRSASRGAETPTLV